MTDKVKAFIEKEGLIGPGQSVLVAFSGGADSTALLSVLLELKPLCGFGEIAAVHLNHGLRAEATRDEKAVRRFCEEKGVRLFLFREEVAVKAAALRKGIEETGRELRYALFRDVAEKERFDRIATAHTKSDQAETLLLHLVRGCGPDGLSGIPVKRGQVVRPLLCCGREEIEAYCAAHDLSFVTDATNADVRYARNRVRHLVMPQLERINPKAEEAVYRLAEAAREDAAYWSALAEETLSSLRAEEDLYFAGKLAKLPVSLKRRVLHRLAGEGAEEGHIRQLADLLEKGGALTLPGGRRATVSQGYLSVEDGGEVKAPAPRPLIPGESYTFGPDTYFCRVEDRALFESKQKVHKILLQFTCDYDKIRGVGTVRTRLPGDGYAPYRRGGYKTLKKWYNAQGVPASRRDRIPVIADENGIALVAGLGCDERTAIDDQTQRILIFSKGEREE